VGCPDTANEARLSHRAGELRPARRTRRNAIGGVSRCPRLRRDHPT